MPGNKSHLHHDFRINPAELPLLLCTTDIHGIDTGKVSVAATDLVPMSALLTQQQTPHPACEPGLLGLVLHYEKDTG